MILIFAPAIPADHPRLTMRIACKLHESGEDVSLIMAPALGLKVPPGLQHIEVKPRHRLRRIGAALMATRHLRSLPHVDSVICGGIDAWIVAVALKPILGWQIAFEVSEDYPAAIRRWAKRDLSQRYLTALVVFTINLLSRFTDVAILARRSNEQQYANAGRTIFLLNSVPDSSLMATEETILSSREGEDRLRIISAGTFSPERGSEILLEALELLCPRMPHASIEITFVGEFVLMDADDYVSRLSSLEVVKSATRHEWVSYDTLLTEVLPDHHVGLALFQPWNDNLRNPMPNKVFDYMARGVVPIAPEWADELTTVVGSAVAYLVDTASAEAVASAVVAALDETARQLKAQNGVRLSWDLADDVSFLRDLRKLLGS